MRRGRMTLKFEGSDENIEEAKNALRSLQKIGCINAAIIHKIPNKDGDTILECMVCFEKLEYENEDKTKLI
jgi:hypothetical protein